VEALHNSNVLKRKVLSLRTLVTVNYALKNTIAVTVYWQGLSASINTVSRFGRSESVRNKEVAIVN
jgi:hypothetical protein